MVITYVAVTLVLFILSALSSFIGLHHAASAGKPVWPEILSIVIELSVIVAGTVVLLSLW